MSSKKNVPANIFKFLWYFSKKYKFRIFLLFFIMGVSTISVSYISPYTLKVLVNLYESKQLSIHIAIVLAVIYVVSLSIGPLFFIFKNKLFLASQDLIKRDFLNYTFTYLLNNDIDYFNKNYSGDLTSKITGLLSGFEAIFRSFLNISNSLLFFLVVLAIVFNFSIYMGLITIIWLALSYLSLKKSIGIRTARFKASSEEKNKSAGIINDCIMNISNIKSFSHEKTEIANVRKQSLNIIRSSGNTVGITAIVMFISYIIKNLYYFIMLSFLFYLFKQGRASLGEFVFMAQVIMTLTSFVRRGLDNIVQINPEIAKFQNSLDKILIEPKIKDRERAGTLRVKNGKIVLKNIKFSYCK